MTTAPVILLDKDGTLVENVPYNTDPALLRFTPGAAAAVRQLHQDGYLIAVISNQSGVALGRFPESALAAVEQRLREMLAELGVPLAGFFYCPHHPEGTVEEYAQSCDCRKPASGLVTRAAETLGVDPARCWVVGDILDDVEAGSRVGCTTILLDNGGETEWRLTPWRIPDYLAHDLLEAAEIVAAVEEASLIVRARREASVASEPPLPDSTAPSEW